MTQFLGMLSQLLPVDYTDHALVTFTLNPRWKPSVFEVWVGLLDVVNHAAGPTGC